MKERDSIIAPALSVLIPNFNYGRYLDETIKSVLVQAGGDTEVIVCDNASTDDSVECVRAMRDDRIRLEVNPCNLGFAANLERVASLARGRRMLLLSSDDRMALGALRAYRDLEEALGSHADVAVWGASTRTIDADGRAIGRVDPDPKLWGAASNEPELSARLGMRVRSMPALELLRRSLQLLRTPLPFATTCYPRTLHDAVGGYSGGRLMNPDKWFLWKLLSVAETAYMIEHPLFDYRVHGSGQASIEQRSGALKHLTDEYVATFNLPASVLERSGLSNDELAAAFMEQDIALRGLVSLAKGQRRTARRMVAFGIATYPELARSNIKLWALRALLKLGPLGTHIARSVQEPAERQWRQEQSRPLGTQ